MILVFNISGLVYYYNDVFVLYFNASKGFKCCAKFNSHTVEPLFNSILSVPSVASQTYRQTARKYSEPY